MIYLSYGVQLRSVGDTVRMLSVGGPFGTVAPSMSGENRCLEVRSTPSRSRTSTALPVDGID